MGLIRKMSRTVSPDLVGLMTKLFAKFLVGLQKKFPLLRTFGGSSSSSRGTEKVYKSQD